MRSPPRMLELKSDAAVNLHAFSGRVEAFAEVCFVVDCLRASKELFAWDGWHQTYPLVALDKRIEVLALRTVKE